MRTILLLFVVFLFSIALQVEAFANSPPIADAGPDKTVFVGDSVQLQGSASDPDGDPIVLFWSVVSQPIGSSPYITDPHRPDPHFGPDMPGDYVLSLVVTDGAAWSEPDSVTVHALEDQPPTAIATADVTTGSAPLTVNFDGSQSFDPEGGVLIYRWDFGDGSITSAEISPTHVYESPGVYMARLTVIDDRGQYHEDAIQITVTGGVPVEPTTWGRIKALFR